MAREIERKFLLAGDEWRREVSRSLRMEQGYLAHSDRASIRVRIAGDEAYLNIKGGGFVAVRAEYEYSIPLEDGRELLEGLCARPPVSKTRHWVAYGGFVWEIDEFHGANQGLLVAEIELASAEQTFRRPPWLGAEVTHLHRYYNVCLVDHPYREWNDSERAGP